MCWKQHPELPWALFVLFIHFSPGGTGGEGGGGVTGVDRVASGTAWERGPPGTDSGDPRYRQRSTRLGQPGVTPPSPGTGIGGSLLHVGPLHEPFPLHCETPGKGQLGPPTLH